MCIVCLVFVQCFDVVDTYHTLHCLDTVNAVNDVAVLPDVSNLCLLLLRKKKLGGKLSTEIVCEVEQNSQRRRRVGKI